MNHPSDTDSDPDPPAIQCCGRCGEPGVRYREDKRFDCPACGWVLYKNPSAAVVALLEVGDRVVFTRRNRDPGLGLLDLPGGFVDPGETAEETVARELDEELGIRPDVLAAHYLGSIPNTYPYRGVTYKTIDLFYRIPIATVPDVAQPDEIQAVTALRPDEIDLGDIAFESIRLGLARWVLGAVAAGPASQPAP